MKRIKTIFLLLFFTVTLFPMDSIAQWDEGVAAVKSDVHPQVQRLVSRHLRAIVTQSYPDFKSTFRGQNVFNDTILNHFRAATSFRYINRQVAQNFRSNPPLGFNLGVVLEKLIVIIVPVNKPIRQSQRLPYDILGISAELGAGLRKQGVKTSQSIALLVDPHKMSIVKPTERTFRR